MDDSADGGDPSPPNPPDEEARFPTTSIKALSNIKGFEESLAMTLLNSTDAKVVAAAKRIFFNSPDEQSNKPSTGPSPEVTSSNSPTTKAATLLDPVSRPKAVGKACKPRAETIPLSCGNSGQVVPSTYSTGKASKNGSSVASLKGTGNVPVPLQPEAPMVSTVVPSKLSQKPAPTGFASSHGSGARSKAPGEPKKKQSSTSERLQRSRERNRMHARRTRMRKKEHMKTLKDRADQLKQEHLKLKQVINDKNTANILLVMCSSSSPGEAGAQNVDPKVDDLMKRSVDEIPDASRITELPTLYLPGHHSQARKRKGVDDATELEQVLSTGDDECHEKTGKGLPHDDIDYELLGKDRSKCTPAELDRIRRERNRMHAKRTRDRKRLFMEEMEELIKQLEGENAILQEHIDGLDGKDPCSSPRDSPMPILSSDPPRTEAKKAHVIVGDQLQSLLAAATCDHKGISSIASAVSASTSPSGNVSLCDEEELSGSIDCSTSPFKKQCVEKSRNNTTVATFPSCITTKNSASVNG